MAYLYDPKYISIEGQKFPARELDKDTEPFHHAFLLTSKQVDPDTIYAFKSEKTMRAWLKDRDLLGWWQEHRKRPKIERTEKEIEENARYQKAEVKRLTKRYEENVARLGIDPADDIRKFTKALENYDRHRGPILASAVIYEHCGFRGRPIFIANGMDLCDFRRFFFNDIASSVVTSSGTLTLWRNINTPLSCPSGAFDIGITIGRYRAVSCLTLLGFNDTASSAEMTLAP